MPCKHLVVGSIPTGSTVRASGFTTYKALRKVNESSKRGGAVGGPAARLQPEFMVGSIPPVTSK